MKTLPIFLLALSLLSGGAHAQILISNASPVILNFNNLNTNFGGTYNSSGGSTVFPITGAAALAVYSGGPNSALNSNFADYAPGGVYSNTSTYNTSNSMRALQDGSTSDLALGLKTSSTQNFTLRMQNSTADSVSVFTLSYAIEQYSQGGSATPFTLSYSLNGTSFITTNQTGGAAVTAVTGTDGNLASVLSTTRSATITETIAPSGEIYFRWTYTHISGTSPHLGLDDVSVNPTFVPEASITSFFGFLGALSLLHRRR